MPSATFQSLQFALERIADSPRRAAGEKQSTLSATLDGLTVIYTLNEEEGTLSVVNIVRADNGRTP